MKRWFRRGGTNRDGVLVGLAISLLFAILDASGIFETLPWWGWAIIAAAIAGWHVADVRRAPRARPASA